MWQKTWYCTSGLWKLILNGCCFHGSHLPSSSSQKLWQSECSNLDVRHLQLFLFKPEKLLQTVQVKIISYRKLKTRVFCFPLTAVCAGQRTVTWWRDFHIWRLTLYITLTLEVPRHIIKWLWHSIGIYSLVVCAKSRALGVASCSGFCTHHSWINPYTVP